MNPERGSKDADEMSFVEKFLNEMKSEIQRNTIQQSMKYGFDFESERPMKGSKLKWLDEIKPSGEC